jgi:hypothetical protein
MDYLKIEQNIGSTERVESSVIEKLRTLAITSNVQNPSNTFIMEVSGQLSPRAAYEDSVAYLTSKFDNLLINTPSNGYYVRFRDYKIGLLTIELSL